MSSITINNRFVSVHKKHHLCGCGSSTWKLKDGYVPDKNDNNTFIQVYCIYCYSNHTLLGEKGDWSYHKNGLCD